jgi:hypothetical protein
MQEYYIRNQDADESRGPFTLEQLTSLAETGNLTLDSLIYDPDREAWEVLENHESLRQQIFPERKRLTFRNKTEYESLNSGEAELPPVTIDALLAAAEGATEETRHKKKDSIWRERAATLAMYLAGIAFLLSAMGSIWIQRETLFSFEVMAIIVSPLILFGLVDLGIALILFLQTTAVYPLIRFRTMLGAGFYLFIFWAAGYPLAGVAAAIGSVGIFGLTLFLKKALFLSFAALALLGMGAFVVMAFGI